MPSVELSKNLDGYCQDLDHSNKLSLGKPTGSGKLSFLRGDSVKLLNNLPSVLNGDTARFLFGPVFPGDETGTLCLNVLFGDIT